MKKKDMFKIKKIYFNSNGFRLRGFLHLPETFPERVMVGSHGLSSTSESPKQIALAGRCCENGIAFFRFDHRGCGKSDGDFRKDTTFEGRVNDLSAAIQTILDCSDTGNKIALFGSSMGGAASISVYERFDVEAIFVLAAPVKLSQINTSPDEIKDLFGSDPETLKKQISFDLSDKLAGLKNILIFHGDDDEVVPYKNAEDIYRYANSPKKLIKQAKGDHRMSNASHQREFLDEIIKWYLGIIQN